MTFRSKAELMGLFTGASVKGRFDLTQFEVAVETRDAILLVATRLAELTVETKKTREALNLTLDLIEVHANIGADALKRLAALHGAARK